VSGFTDWCLKRIASLEQTVNQTKPSMLNLPKGDPHGPLAWRVLR